MVANGDIALDEFDLEEVFLELGKLNLPVIVFAGTQRPDELTARQPRSLARCRS